MCIYISSSLDGVEVRLRLQYCTCRGIKLKSVPVLPTATAQLEFIPLLNACFRRDSSFYVDIRSRNKYTSTYENIIGGFTIENYIIHTMCSTVPRCAGNI